ncbi:MAG TPA: gephyrin-like molybdotransferase Glp [Bryobacteraceae bacterium]|nr:gephyrin-like molybdotransferase Glp [Bryobacteraceae bacterium]
MGSVPALTFGEARECVLRTVLTASPPTEILSLTAAAGRVLAVDVTADRLYPPFPRSVRDGFAVDSSSFRGRARVVGEVAAGSAFGRALQPGEAVEIMTGAPVPEGADAVFMVEHAALDGATVSTDRHVQAGDFIVPAGAEAAAGAVIVRRGTTLNHVALAALATVGCAEVQVYRKCRVAVLATGDELVAVEATPERHQIRNSNSVSLATQVARAGGEPDVLPCARDDADHTRAMIERGLTSDLLLISGGVSAGKHDLVERVLAELGAEFYFDRVLIQPGQPLVFGRVRDRFFFGLPGNPSSTMVTFELFARAALERLAGIPSPALNLTHARLVSEFRHKPGLTRFLPAFLEGGVRPLAWQGSGDVFALARANCFLVARDNQERWAEGDFIEVLPQ